MKEKPTKKVVCRTCKGTGTYTRVTNSKIKAGITPCPSCKGKSFQIKYISFL